MSAVGRTVMAAAVLLILTLVPITGQTGPSDLQIQQAAAAIEQADGYAQIVAATTKYADVISSPRVVQMVDGLLKNPALDETQRGILLLERQLSIDCLNLGAAAAAKLLAVRVIAGSAIAADTPQQFAAVLDKFSPLAVSMNAELVRQALNTPGNNWPAALVPLMEQLARDWPKLGSLAAATRMADAANANPPPGQKPDPKPTPNPTPTLVGHWRSTSIVFESPRDEHLVLNANGTAETWVVTASGRTGVMRGRWNVKGTFLSVSWDDGREWGQPFTFFQGQLVFPNVPNQRQFWEAIR